MTQPTKLTEAQKKWIFEKFWNSHAQLGAQVCTDLMVHMLENGIPDLKDEDSDITKRYVEIIEKAGGRPKSYSGRGMYGKKCIAVDLEQLGDLVFFKDASSPAVDSLGKGYIAYWPSVPPPMDEREECEECGHMVPSKESMENRYHDDGCSLYAPGTK